MFVFDVDGVLIDSANLIRLSYRMAGASPPDDVLARERTGWLAGQVGAALAPEIHRRKNGYYLRGLREVPFLPPLLTASHLALEGYEVGAVTAAPHGTIDALRRRIAPWPFVTATDGMRTSEKMRFLPVLASEGVYVDDQDRLIDMPDGWRFVHYVGQTNDQLYREIME